MYLLQNTANDRYFDTFFWKATSLKIKKYTKTNFKNIVKNTNILGPNKCLESTAGHWALGISDWYDSHDAAELF